MNVRTFENEVPAWLATPLEDFEREFTYPLGESTRFRISHGTDYLRFFRSMGEAACVIAEKDARVLGTISAAIVSLSTPEGPKRALYVGDLKIAASARGTRVLFLLARAMEAWGAKRVQAAFAVVMDGTQVTPPMYTGRAGLPAFAPLAEVSVLRLPAPARESSVSPRYLEEAALLGGDSLRALVAQGAIANVGGQPALRSMETPTWLVYPGGLAAGRLEDTARAKRLFRMDGVELESAHFSCFRFSDASAAAALLLDARARLAASPRALFCACDRRAVESLLSALRAHDAQAAGGATVAGATVYGTGLPANVPWIVNTSEI